jgi:hypothetical protein
LCLSAGNRRNRIGEEMALFSQSQLCLGAPDYPVLHRTVSGAPGWLRRTSCSREVINGVRLKFTGLSGVQRSARPMVSRAIRAGHVVEPTVSRGHRTVHCAPDSVRCANGSKAVNGRLRQIRKEIRTGLSGVPGDRRQELPSWNALNGS